MAAMFCFDIPPGKTATTTLDGDSVSIDVLALRHLSRNVPFEERARFLPGKDTGDAMQTQKHKSSLEGYVLELIFEGKDQREVAVSVLAVNEGCIAGEVGHTDDKQRVGWQILIE